MPSRRIPTEFKFFHSFPLYEGGPQGVIGFSTPPVARNATKLSQSLDSLAKGDKAPFLAPQIYKLQRVKQGSRYESGSKLPRSTSASVCLRSLAAGMLSVLHVALCDLPEGGCHAH